MYHDNVLILFCGTTTQVGPHCWGFMNHTQLHKHTCYNSSEWTVSSLQRPLPFQHTTNIREKYIHALIGIQTCNPSSQAAASLCHRLHDHWVQLVFGWREKCLLYCRLRLCILYIQVNCTLLVGACTSLEVLLCEYHLALLCVLLTNNKVNFCIMWDVTLSKLTCNITELPTVAWVWIMFMNTGCRCLLLSRTSDLVMCPPCFFAVMQLIMGLGLTVGDWRIGGILR